MVGGEVGEKSTTLPFAEQLASKCKTSSFHLVREPNNLFFNLFANYNLFIYNANQINYFYFISKLISPQQHLPVIKHCIYK